jgi:hypothetical protein
VAWCYSIIFILLWLSGEVATIAIKYNVVTSLMVDDNKKHPAGGRGEVGTGN